MAKNNKKVGSYQQTRSMKVDKNGKAFDITLTIDGDIGKVLERANNPIISALTFAAFAVQVAANIRQNAHKKGANLSVVNMQNLANVARPKIGKSFDPIKKKDRVMKDLSKSVSVMTASEKAELKKMLG